MGWSTEKINIEELKRQALLGDEEAQRECTRRGIELPCPCCKTDPDTSGWNGHYFMIKCRNCGLEMWVTEDDLNEQSAADFADFVDNRITIEELYARAEKRHGPRWTARERWNRRPAPPTYSLKDQEKQKYVGIKVSNEMKSKKSKSEVFQKCVKAEKEMASYYVFIAIASLFTLTAGGTSFVRAFIISILLVLAGALLIALFTYVEGS